MKHLQKQAKKNPNRDEIEQHSKLSNQNAKQPRSRTW